MLVGWWKWCEGGTDLRHLWWHTSPHPSIWVHLPESNPHKPMHHDGFAGWFQTVSTCFKHWICIYIYVRIYFWHFHHVNPYGNISDMSQLTDHYSSKRGWKHVETSSNPVNPGMFLFYWSVPSSHRPCHPLQPGCVALPENRSLHRRPRGAPGLCRNQSGRGVRWRGAAGGIRSTAKMGEVWGKLEGKIGKA